MKQITTLTKSIVLIGSALAFVAVVLSPLRASAQAIDNPVYKEKGCYLVTGVATRGVPKISCDKYKLIYPTFNPDPNKCYFGWDTGFGASKPVSISCSAGPISTTPLVEPAGGVPGGDPAPPGPNPTTPTPSTPTTISYAPGCYIEVFHGFGPIDCAKFKPVYPNFVPDASKCYFGWDTGMGPSPPVAIDCKAGPTPGTPIILPSDNKPGNPPVGVKDPTERIEADKKTFNSDQCNGKAVTSTDNCILDDINVVINVLSAGVGIIVVITIMTAGIQYITAGGDPQKISQAKNRIRNAVFALLAFAFLFSFLQWIVPGGIIP